MTLNTFEEIKSKAYNTLEMLSNVMYPSTIIPWCALFGSLPSSIIVQLGRISLYYYMG
jgi:hypothetical protein